MPDNRKKDDKQRKQDKAGPSAPEPMKDDKDRKKPSEEDEGVIANDNDVDDEDEITQRNPRIGEEFPDAER